MGNEKVIKILWKASLDTKNKCSRRGTYIEFGLRTSYQRDEMKVKPEFYAPFEIL